MKKNICIVCALLVLGAVLTAFSPSIDGRAVVADKGEMPSGLFAKTVGYLPGDSVNVTNPSNGKSIDVLVLGSLDPSEGVAILLSSDAAKQLDIRKDSNILVKLTKRTGKADESVYGMAVIAQNSSAVPEGEASAAPETGSVTEKLQADNTVPAATVTTEPVADTVPPVAPVPVSPAESEAPEKVTTSSEGEEKVSTVETPVEAIAETVPETSAVTEKAADKVPAATEPVADTEPPAAPVPASSAESEAVEESTVSSEAKEKVSTVETPSEAIAAPVPETPVAAEKVQADKLPVAPAATEPVVDAEPPAAPVPASPVEIEPPEEIPALSEKKESTSAVVPEGSGSDGENKVYAPIILVPAEPKPPVASGKAKEEYAPESDSLTPPAAVAPEEKPADVSSAPDKTVPPDINRYIVPNLKSLDSGKYYVQIAVLKNENNIRDLLSDYGTHYPLVVVPLSMGTAYQVMVGPLGRDEYGTVMIRFREKGFKDAFLRKIR